MTVALSSLRGQRIALPGDIVVVNDCYNANPMSMRAALDDLAASASGRRVAVLGDMLELGPGEVAYHEEIAAVATRRASTCSSPSARSPRTSAPRSRASARHVADARAAAALLPDLLEPGDTVLVKASRGVGLEVVAEALEPDGRLMGEVLIAGTASLLICIFLSPKFIAFLRAREFGQYIREEGPEGHHEKAGTPTMGGIIIFTAISIPFLILGDYDWRSVGVFGAAIACAALGFADDYTKIVKRRSLGLRARTKLGVTIAISIGLWWVATHEAGLADTSGCARSTSRSTSASSTRC